MDDILADLYKRQPYYKIHEGACITSKNRDIVVNWMRDTCKRFRNEKGVYYIAVNLLDRSIVTLQANLKSLQLISCTCMFIASKMEEVFRVDSGDYAFISDYTFTVKDLIDMERQVLAGLKFYINPPTCFHFYTVFLNILSLVDRGGGEEILSMAVTKSYFLKYAPSELAAGVIYLTHFLHKPEMIWMEQITHLNAEQVLNGVVYDLSRHFQ